jgi:acyl-CoA synthetase (AMP-forming)/AMP-acid ligase II
MEKITNIGCTINMANDLNKPAIIDLSESEPRIFSYDKLNQTANAVARGLSNQNIKINDKVAILSNNSFEYLASFYGILRLGAVPVLVNNKLSVNQIREILVESESKLLLTDGIEAYGLDFINFKSNFQSFLDYGEFSAFEPIKDSIAFLLYTSGSSGNPKGAMITHHGHAWILSKYLKIDEQWGSKRISLISAPMYHANGLTTIEFSIAVHSTVVLLPKFNPKDAILAIDQFKVNTFFCVPTMLSMMFQEKELLKNINLSSVKNIRSASSAISDKLLENIKKHFPNCIINNGYGITEVGPGLFGPHPDGITRPEQSVGYPAADIEYRIIDSILQIKSPSMMTAYYKKDSTNAITKDGFFITGDLFEIDENGFYFFIGRNDDMFKSGGNKIFPVEVESILETHPAVSGACVISLPDEIKGAKPYAFVVLETEKCVNEEELKEYFLKNGAAYQHPRRIWFLDHFPLTGSNKINKKELYELAKNLTTEK